MENNQHVEFTGALSQRFEQCFKTSDVAKKTAKWGRRLKNFEDSPWWLRLLKGGIITRLFLATKYDYYFDAYLREELENS